MYIDLHGYSLWNAREEVLYILEELKFSKTKILKIIHGFKRGRILKNYFNSIEFISEANKYGINLKKMDRNKNPGETIFKII